MATSWTCPYCNQNATITDPNQSIDRHKFTKGNREEAELWLETVVRVCPNVDCREYVIDAILFKTRVHQLGAPTYQQAIRAVLPVLAEWRLRPRSRAKVLPNYIPSQLIADYEEACLIVNDSPKASATLSRRCLQGMIRDFFGVSKPTLHAEIQAIEEKVDPATWQAIDAVRKIGNIGAHMEMDISVIIDVEPGEAELLIQLLETLFQDWYIIREKRAERMRQIVELAQAKTPTKA